MSVERSIVQKLLRLHEAKFTQGHGSYKIDGKDCEDPELWHRLKDKDSNNSASKFEVTPEYEEELISKYSHAEIPKDHGGQIHYQPSMSYDEDSGVLTLFIRYKNKKDEESKMVPYTYNIKHAMETPHEVSLLQDLDIMMNAPGKSEDSRSRMVLNYVNKNPEKFEVY